MAVATCRWFKVRSGQCAEDDKESSTARDVVLQFHHGLGPAPPLLPGFVGDACLLRDSVGHESSATKTAIALRNITIHCVVFVL